MARVGLSPRVRGELYIRMGVLLQRKWSHRRVRESATGPSIFSDRCAHVGRGLR